MSEKLELDPKWALGPQHAEVMAMLETLATLTDKDLAKLGEAYIFDPDTDDEEDNDRLREWGDAGEDAERAARDSALWGLDELHMKLAIALLTKEVRYRKMPDGALYAVDETVLALATRHLVGYYEYTQEHYDMLTAPWRVAIGRIHPNDKELTEHDLPKYDY